MLPTVRLHKFDVKMAFLYPDAWHKSFMEQLPHFEIPSYPQDQYVCLAHKGLYCRHESGNLWYENVK